MKFTASCGMILATLGVVEDAANGGTWAPEWFMWFLAFAWVASTVWFILCFEVREK